MRVLLIEDDPQTTRHVTATLAKRGHDVRSASDLASARSMCVPEPDILIVDRMLPDGDGIEL
ncbi:response regulator, partial [Acinetobacter baumannii]